MLQGEHSAVLLTCIKLPNGFKTFVLCIFVWPLKTGFTVYFVCTSQQGYIRTFSMNTLIMHRSRKFCQRGSTYSDIFFLLFLDEEVSDDPNKEGCVSEMPFKWCLVI